MIMHCHCGKTIEKKCRVCHTWTCAVCYATSHGKGSDGRSCLKIRDLAPFRSIAKAQ